MYFSMDTFSASKQLFKSPLDLPIKLNQYFIWKKNTLFYGPGVTWLLCMYHYEYLLIIIFSILNAYFEKVIKSYAPH